MFHVPAAAALSAAEPVQSRSNENSFPWWLTAKTYQPGKLLLYNDPNTQKVYMSQKAYRQSVN